MRKSTAGRPLSQVNTGVARLDFDATQAAATFAASQSAVGRILTAQQPRGGGRGTVACYNNHVSVAQSGERPCSEPGTLATGSQMQGSAQVRVLPDTHSVDVQLNSTSEISHLKCDVELARIAVGLRLSAQIRLWLVIQEYARTTGYNWLTRDSLRNLLDEYHIRYSERNLSRWLRGGHNLFWRLDGQRIWLIGYKKLSTALIDMALSLPKPKRGFDPLNLVTTNNPGFYRSVYVNVTSDNLSQFEAAVFSGWLTAKQNPNISNYVLSLLFRRDPKVIRRWCKIADVTILHTFAHYTEETSHYVPLASEEGGHRGDVIPYTVNGRQRWSAEYSNTYQPQPTRQHPYRGQSLTVSRKAHQQLKSVQAAGPTVQIPYRDGRLYRTGRKLFDDVKLARKNVDADHPREQYLFKSVDNRRCIHLECVPDGRARTRARECERASRVWEGYS